MGEAKPSPPLVTQGAEPARAHSPPARPERRRQGGEVSGADLPGPRPECRFFASRTRCPCALSPAQRKSERGRPVHTCIPSSLSIGCHRRGRRVARTRPPRPLSRASAAPASARLAGEPLPRPLPGAGPRAPPPGSRGSLSRRCPPSPGGGCLEPLAPLPVWAAAGGRAGWPWEREPRSPSAPARQRAAGFVTTRKSRGSAPSL